MLGEAAAQGAPIMIGARFIPHSTVSDFFFMSARHSPPQALPGIRPRAAQGRESPRENPGRHSGPGSSKAIRVRYLLNASFTQIAGTSDRFRSSLHRLEAGRALPRKKRSEILGTDRLAAACPAVRVKNSS